MKVLGDDRLVEVRTPFLRRNDVEETRTMFGHCRFVSPRFATCLVEDGSAAPACSTFRKHAWPKGACLSSRCGIPRHPLAFRENLRSSLTALSSIWMDDHKDPCGKPRLPLTGRWRSIEVSACSVLAAGRPQRIHQH